MTGAKAVNYAPSILGCGAMFGSRGRARLAFAALLMAVGTFLLEIFLSGQTEID